MEITILRRFGGIRAKVSEDLNSAECPIGTVDISWCSDRSINYARVAPYARDYEDWRAWFAKQGVKIRKGEEIKIKIEDEDKTRLVQERQRKLNELKQAFFEGKIRLFCSVSKDGDSPWIERRKWTLKEKRLNGVDLHELVWDILRDVHMEKWCPSTARDGDDITEKIIEEYNRRKARQGNERTIRTAMDYVVCTGCGRRFTYEEACKIGFDFSTNYCGC
jgi:Fe-S cluster biosynthesis and repair protein YggX